MRYMIHHAYDHFDKLMVFTFFVSHFVSGAAPDQQESVFREVGPPRSILKVVGINEDKFGVCPTLFAETEIKHPVKLMKYSRRVVNKSL